MSRRETTMMALIAIGILGVCVVGAMGLDKAENRAKGADESILTIMQIQNKPAVSMDQGEDLKVYWNNLVESLNYTSDVLQGFKAGNISRRDAFLLTTALINVNSKSLSMLEAMEPQDKYKKLHSYTRDGLNSMDLYLWDMAKFWQTGDPYYISRATKDFNSAQEYYALGREEADFVY